MKRTDIERIAAAGLITPEQQAAIIEHFQLNQGRHRHWLLLSLCGLAGALILLGIIMLVSANWESIPSPVKMVTGMLLLVGFWAVWAWQRQTRPLTAEIFGFLGAGMWLADIALYGQIFQLQNPFVEGVFLFLCGVAPIPFLVRQRLLIGVVAVTCFVLLGASLEAAADHWLSLRGLHQSLQQMYPLLRESTFSFMLFWLLLVFWWLFAELCATRGRAFFRAYSWLTLPATLALASALVCCTLDNRGMSIEQNFPCGLMTAGLTLLMLMLLRPRRPWLPWLVFSAQVVAVPLLFCIPVPPLASVCLTFLCGVLTMAAGSMGARVLWVNVGTLLIAVAALCLFADVLGSYTESGLTLIFGGLLLLGGALVLEKQRRRLVSGMAAESTPNPSSAHE